MLAAKDIPNLISVARIVLVFPIIYLLSTRHFDVALGLFFIAGLSDALDGYLAKQFHWQSRMGGLLDPLADKFLLVSTYVALGWQGYLPWLLIALVVLRDLVIVGGAVAYHYRIQVLDAEPSMISKLNTLVQIVLALAVVSSLGYTPLPQIWIQILIWVVATTTILSGLDYVLEWGHRARRNGKAENAD